MIQMLQAVKMFYGKCFVFVATVSTTTCYHQNVRNEEKMLLASIKTQKWYCAIYHWICNGKCYLTQCVLFWDHHAVLSYLEHAVYRECNILFVWCLQKFIIFVNNMCSNGYNKKLYFI